MKKDRKTEKMSKNVNTAGWDTVIRSKRSWFDIDLKGVFKYRDLIGMLVKRNFSVLYKQTILGPAWVVIQPLLTTIVFTVVFGNIAGLPTDGMPKFLFYMAGNILWQFFSKCLTSTSNTFIVNRQIFGKVYFPRLCMPISVAITQLINFGIQFVLFLALVIYYMLQPDTAVRPAWGMIWILPVLLLQTGILGMGCGIIISALTTKYRDLQMLVGFGVHLWMYISPVTYSASMIQSKYPALMGVYMLNPVTPVIEMFRTVFLGVRGNALQYYPLSWAITVIVFFLGVILFSRTEKNFMDTI